MALSIGSRLMHAWNAFKNKDPTTYDYMNLGAGSGIRPDRYRGCPTHEKTIVVSILNRIAMDAAAIAIRHVRLDENGRFVSYMDSELDYALNVEANLDQSGRAFIHDAVYSMLDEGVIAMVPTVRDFDPIENASYKIYEMRVGKIVQWYPKHVKVSVYNDEEGRYDELTLPKRRVAIVENPFYAILNESNSTMKRLVRKLNLLDVVDEQSSSGKLDLIIQLPYTVKTNIREQQAEKRRKMIEDQLTNSKYGIAYVDGTEHITQLNRPVENNLMKQVEYLTSMLYSQLGITQTIMDGTADEKTMMNYYDRTIEPIVSAIVDELNRKFLTKTARKQKQTIMFFRDPFKLVPITEIAEIGDKFTRNEIMSANEIRQTIGLKPSNDPNADKLINKNIRQPDERMNDPNADVGKEGTNQNEQDEESKA